MASKSKYLEIQSLVNVQIVEFTSFGIYVRPYLIGQRMCRPPEALVCSVENRKDAAYPGTRDRRIANFGFLLREWMVLDGAEKF